MKKAKLTLILALITIVFYIGNLHFKSRKLYNIYTLKCWEIAIKKYKGKKQIAKIYTLEYYKLANVLEKCNRCKAKYYVKENKIIE